MTDLPAAARLRGAAGSEFPTLAHFLVASATRDGEAHTIDAEDEVPDLEAAARCQPDAWRAAVLDLRARAAALAAAVAAVERLGTMTAGAWASSLGANRLHNNNRAINK